MIKSLFRISVSVGLLGMAFGIVMGIRQDFALAPAHAHLNLLGFVTMFLSALYYRAFPKAAASRAGALSGRRQRGRRDPVPGRHRRRIARRARSLRAVVVAGALIVFAGMVLFAVIVFRTAGPPAGNPTAASAAPRE